MCKEYATLFGCCNHIFLLSANTIRYKAVPVSYKLVLINAMLTPIAMPQCGYQQYVF